MQHQPAAPLGNWGVGASPPPRNWPDSNKQDILDWLLFPDVKKQRRISLGCQQSPQEQHNALTNVFPDSKAHLCAWHIKNNTIKN
ncbi:hypothetical protein VP01_1777g2 [Puccinia sorghi]|uniref:MULE transposase domain-containing protein n=1 Tax=Puccinia sorghi TaxID=27349 RepID=A0A0L6VGJ1_9BASI|nr:hypothetical protein VP01_1777g2 [Puccinia sorghi]